MPQWTVIVEIDPGLEDAAREAAVDVVSRLVKDADAELAPRSSGSLVAFTSGRESADRLAAAVRATPAVSAAYVKPPEALP
jgi:hypothetical protein